MLMEFLKKGKMFLQKWEDKKIGDSSQSLRF
jgi:hypothetical protein